MKYVPPPPMREALTRLEAQGLVVIIPKKGALVFKPSIEDEQQLASFRLMLETNALEQCLTSDPAAALRGMENALADMTAAPKEKAPRPMRARTPSFTTVSSPIAATSI
jgi:DNA-binding GntR family transcriptional regulator